MTETSSTRPTRVRWLVFFLACGTSWFLYLHRYSWGIIKPDIKSEFGLSDEQLGWLDSAFFGAYALLQIPAGLLGDLIGPALVIPLLLLGWSGAVGATPAAGGFWQLAGARAVFGAFQAGAYPNLGKVTRSWFPLQVRTTMQGMVASLAGRGGGACAGLIVGALLLGQLALGWRAALGWTAAAGAIFAFFFWFLYRDSPSRHPWANDAERRLVEAGEPPATPGAKVAFRRDGATLFSFLGLLLQLFSAAFNDMLFVNWIPLYLEEAKGLDKIQMGIFASLPLWGGAFGGMAGGILNDALARAVGRRLARKVVGSSGRLIAAGLVAASIGVEDGRWMMAMLAAAKFFTDWGQPTTWGTITDIGGPAAGRIFGAVNMVGCFGAFAAGPLFGLVKQHGGWAPLFWMVVAVYVFSGLCWLAVDCTRRLAVEVTPPESDAGRSG